MTLVYGRQAADPFLGTNSASPQARRLKVGSEASSLIQSLSWKRSTSPFNAFTPDYFTVYSRETGGAISVLTGVKDTNFNPYTNYSGSNTLTAVLATRIYANFAVRYVRSGGAGQLGYDSIALLARLGKNLGRILPVISTGLQIYDAFQLASEVYNGFLLKGLADRPGELELFTVNGEPWIYTAADNTATTIMPPVPEYRTSSEWALRMSLADDLSLFLNLAVDAARRGSVLGYLVEAISSMIDYMEFIPNLLFTDFVSSFMDSGTSNATIRLNPVYRVISSMVSLSLEFNEDGVAVDSEGSACCASDYSGLGPVLDKYFLLEGTDPVSSPNITQVLPSATRIDIYSNYSGIE